MTSAPIRLSSPDPVDAALADYLRDHGRIATLRGIRQHGYGKTLVVAGRSRATDPGFSTPVRSIRLYGCLRDYHRAETRHMQGLHIADPVTISLNRLLGGIGILNLAVTECRPPDCLRARAILLDSANGSEPAVVKMSVGGSELSTTHQISILSYCRYRLVGCISLLREPMNRERFLTKAGRNDQVILAHEEFGFTDPAMLADYFADIGYGTGYFTETVLFGGTVTTFGTLLFFAFAVDELAAGPELLRELQT